MEENRVSFRHIQFLVDDYKASLTLRPLSRAGLGITINPALTKNHYGDSNIRSLIYVSFYSPRLTTASDSDRCTRRSAKMSH
ncbi:uncharacterized protein PHALS_04795 [Plasmopara halstedii]|uniref:Uncharacterized protein n=1 Tax=Plasmopara halstedii TaxID=4781 RepID=A0A0P1AYU5_PLAHL|nr:uncharacterized protein PHALS_04795 [Plasmopara halstedii]CEG47647.1 hypothetical protein PHALS_04795 [Plasmopara halstedii]|eukprot:XP_024584016.1 hypothetical protein PHALS_04795 [Plasmopara halstedii]